MGAEEQERPPKGRIRPELVGRSLAEVSYNMRYLSIKIFDERDTGGEAVVGEFGRYGAQRSTGRALESLRECLEWNGPPENHLGALRSDHGLTQAKLASRSGVAQGYLSEVEAGKKNLSQPAAEKIAHVLGVDPGVLLMGVRMGALKNTLESGEGRGPLTKEIVGVMALIAENLPDGSLKQLLMATLTEALQDAVERDKQGAPAPQGAALKSKRNPSRDQWGRRVEEEPRAEVALKTRDGLGRSRSKGGRIERDNLGRNKANRRRQG